jgi:hypothetical protein
MTESMAVIAEPFVKLGLTGYEDCYAALAKNCVADGSHSTAKRIAGSENRTFPSS